MNHGPTLPAYEAYLNDQGCSPGLFHRSTATARHMIAWLTINESEVATLDIRGVYRFLRHDCHCPADVRNQSAAPSPWHAHRFLGYLLETGQAAVPASIVTGGGLVETFAATLVAQGYQEGTVRGVRSSCRHLVVWLYRSELRLPQHGRGQCPAIRTCASWQPRGCAARGSLLRSLRSRVGPPRSCPGMSSRKTSRP